MIVNRSPLVAKVQAPSVIVIQNYSLDNFLLKLLVLSHQMLLLGLILAAGGKLS